MFKNTLTLRARALVLAALAFPVMLGMLGYLAVTERGQEIENAKMHLLHTVETITAQQKLAVALGDQTLLRLMQLPEVREIATRLTQLKSAPDGKCSAFLGGRLKEAPGFMNMGIIAVNGDVLCNALQPKFPINVADRSYFQQALKSRELVLSDVILVRANNMPTVAFARALRDDADTVRGVAWVSLDLVWLEKELAKARLPQGGHVGLLDANGTVLARYPDQEGWIGRNTSGMPLFKTLLAKRGEGAVEELGLDGLLRVFAFAPFADTTGGRIFLWVSVPRAVVTAKVESRFGWTLAIATALLLLTFGAFWVGGERMLLRPVSRLSEASRRIARGELGARSGLGHFDNEVGRLARSFDDMAASIQANETGLRQMNRALRVLSAGNRTLVRARSEPQLLREMCRSIAEAGGYRMVWVGYAQDDPEKSVRPMGSWGGEEGLLDAARVSWGEGERGRGPTGTAIRRGIPIVVRDTVSDPGIEPWRDIARRHGYASAVSLPVRINGAVKGALTICAAEADAFGDDEVALLAEAATDLSFGLDALRARAEQARLLTTVRTAEERFRATAEASLDAMFILASVRAEDGTILDFQFTDINRRAEEMLGMKREHVIGQKLCELIPINRTGGFFEKYVAVATTGTPLEEEFPIDTPEIKAKWLRHQVVRVEDGIAISSRDISEWKAAGDRLRESERRLRLALEAAHMGAWSLEVERGEYSLSEGAGPVFGLPPGEGPRTAAAWLERVHPADREGVERLIAENRASVAPSGSEYRLLWPDGTIRWVESRSAAVCDAAGRLVRRLGTLIDVTERKLADERLRRSEAKFRLLFNAPADTILVCRLDGRIVEVNQPAVERLGYSREELLTMTSADIDAPDIAALVPARLAEIERTGWLVAETVNRCKDGSLKPGEINSRVVEYEGAPAVLTVLRDTTERKKAEERIRQAELRYRTLFEQAPVGVVIIDLETGLAEECNEVAHNDLGYTKEEFLRLRVSGYEALESQQAIAAHTQKILRQRGDTFDTLHFTKSGELRNVHVMMRVLDLADRQLLYCIYQDTTEQRKIEMSLKRANRALRTLSAANEMLVHASSEQEMLEAACRIIVEEGGYRAAGVGYAQEDSQKSIKAMALSGVEHAWISNHPQTWADTELGQRPISRAMRSGKTEVTRDIASDPAFSPWKDDAIRQGYASNIALPLLEKAKVIGALIIYCTERDAFDEEEIHLLQELASDLSYGIATLRITREHAHHEEILRESLEQSIQAIADTVDMRDPYTAGHQRRVGELAVAVAQELGLPEDKIHGIRLAASVHDLGKIKVPAEILSKPGKLTEIEFMLIKTHPQAGYEILKDIKFPWPIADIVRQHHERLDGSGYPENLKDGQILIESRIMAVADVIEAMASHRPYRPSLGIKAALAEIERGRDSAYDAAVVDACLKLFREGKLPNFKLE